MKIPSLLFVSMLIALTAICLRHGIWQLLDDLGKGVMTLIDPLGLFLSVWGGMMATHPVTRADASRIDLAQETR